MKGSSRRQFHTECLQSAGNRIISNIRPCQVVIIFIILKMSKVRHRVLCNLCKVTQPEHGLCTFILCTLISIPRAEGCNRMVRFSLSPDDEGGRGQG